MNKVEIIADSITPRGHRLTTFSCEYWRAILAEVNTHRMLSRNSPSSRAIPVETMIQRIIDDPAMPITWPKNQKGMQASENLDAGAALRATQVWLDARDSALGYAKQLVDLGLHKQVANRILEPWMYTKSLISATDWENFFHLRVHKDAQPDFQDMAHKMLRAYLKNEPVKLEFGDWHIPYSGRMPADLDLDTKIKIAVGRACRVSYYSQDGTIDIMKDITLHDRCAVSIHMSVMEHVARADDTDNYFGNFQGWYQYRKSFEKENQTGNLHDLLANYEASIGIGRNCNRCGRYPATIDDLCPSCYHESKV